MSLLAEARGRLAQVAPQMLRGVPPICFEQMCISESERACPHDLTHSSLRRRGKMVTKSIIICTSSQRLISLTGCYACSIGDIRGTRLGLVWIILALMLKSGVGPTGAARFGRGLGHCWTAREGRLAVVAAALEACRISLQPFSSFPRISII